MEIHEHTDTNTLLIEKYHQNGIVINQQQYGNIAICHQGIIPLPSGSFTHNIDEHIFQAALDIPPELLIIGTGLQRIALPPKIEVILHQRGMGVDIMNTAAACRTFNLLQSEGRVVYAWLWLA